MVILKGYDTLAATSTYVVVSEKPHLELSNATWFVRISILVVEIQVK